MATRATDRPRREFIGASEGGALLGLDPYESRFDLWSHKTGRLPPNNDDEPQFRRGRTLEPIVRTDELPRRDDVLATYDPEPGEFWLDEDSGLGSHPDGKIEMTHPTLELPGKGALEIKTTNREVFDIIRDHGLPAANVCQLNTTIGHTGAAWGAFGVFCADSWETLLFPMTPDQALYEFMIAEAKRFRDEHIIPGIAPELFPAEQVPDIPVLAGSLVHVLGDAEWDELMEEYQLYVETKKVLAEIWPDEERLDKDILAATDSGEDRPLTLKERIRNKMIELGTEQAQGSGWKWFYRPGATATRFERLLLTQMGPFDPDVVQRILDDELRTRIPTGAHVQQIMARLGMEARVTGDDTRFMRTTTQPYFRAFPVKEGR